MAVPVVASSAFTTDAANATSRTVTKPSGTVSGDWLLGITAIDGTSAITIPTGFTSIIDKVNDGGTARLTVYKRKADGTEGANFTIGSASEAGNHFMLRITGADSTDCVDTFSYCTGESDTIPALRLYAECNDSLILYVAGNDGGVAITDPASTTAVLNKTGVTAGCSLSVVSVDQASAGDAITRAFTQALEQFSSVTLAIRSTSTPAAYPAQPYIRNMNGTAPPATTALTYPLPHGVQNGDLLLTIQSSDTTAVLTTLSGHTVNQSDNNTAIFGQVQWKIAASESADYTGSNVTSAAKQGVMMLIKNVDQTTPINQSATPAKGTSTAPAASTITPSVNNCLIVAAEVNDDDDVTDNSGYPSGYDGVVSWDTSQGADAGMIVASVKQTTAAATGAATFTLALLEEWLTFHLAIAPAATTAYTLTASTVSFALTGVAAALKYDRKLVATTQTYSLTGNDSTLRKGYPLAAAVGTFTLTGQATGLRHGYRLACVTASFSLTGIAASLEYGRRFTVDTANFTLTGRDAAFPVTRRLTAESASYALTGVDTSLEYGRIIAAAPASYSLTGNDANLIYAPHGAYIIVAETASFVLTGNAATLVKTATAILQAETGRFAFTGSAATFSYAPNNSLGSDYGGYLYPVRREERPKPEIRSAAHRPELLDETRSIQQEDVHEELERLSAIAALRKELAVSQSAKADHEERARISTMRRELTRLDRLQTAAKNRALREEDAFMMLLAA